MVRYITPFSKYTKKFSLSNPFSFVNITKRIKICVYCNGHGTVYCRECQYPRFLNDCYKCNGHGVLPCMFCNKSIKY